MHTPRLFGTDGIRDIANRGVLTPESVLKLGKVLGNLLMRNPECFSVPPGLHNKIMTPLKNAKPRVLLARDTRISGPMLENALSAGLLSSGVDVTSLGVAPTPALAYLTRLEGYHLGIVISASHNPVADNGIKLISSEGIKIAERMELKIEKTLLCKHFKAYLPKTPMMGMFTQGANANGLSLYQARLIQTILGPRYSLKGITIALDCANGATARTAPYLLQRLGARVHVINQQSDGFNINKHCGSLYPSVIQHAVIKYRADIGCSFDGDGDRAILVDERGNIRDGDYILAITARYFKKYDCLPKNLIVTTVMSNKGLEVSLKEAGIKMTRTAVGDKYVMEKMLDTGSMLGGEQSGHIIFLNYSMAGDGLITLLETLKVMKQTGRTLFQLAQCMDKYPQVLLNVPVLSKPPLERLEPVQQAITEAHNMLGDHGRVLVRYSGTEPLVRIMIEGKSKPLINSLALKIKRAIQQSIKSTE